MKSLCAFLLLVTGVVAHASTVYEYVGTPDTCGGQGAGRPSPCPGTLHATLTLRDDGTPDRVEYSWRGYRDLDPYLSLTIQRHPLPSPGWTESVRLDDEGWDVFVRQRYQQTGPGGPPYNIINMGYDSPDNWFAQSADNTGQYISVNTAGSSYMYLDVYWAATGRLSRVPEPAPLLLAVPLLALLWRLRRRTMLDRG